MVLTRMNSPRAQQINRAFLLNTLRYHPGQSRAGLARETGLSTTTAANLVNELLGEGLLIETDERQGSRRGRKGAVVRLNPAWATAIGVELTDRELRALVVDFTEQPLNVLTRDVEGLEQDELVRLLSDTVAELAATVPAGTRLGGAAIGIHGLVDVERQMSLSFPGKPNWDPIPLAELVEQRVGIRAHLQVRMLAATTAELRYGAGRQLDNFVYFNSAPRTGFGAGLVVDGRVVTGERGFSGQLGHLCVDPAGQQCYCGSRGCLSAVASPAAVAQHAASAVRDGVETMLARMRTDARELAFSDVVAAARQGDKFSVNLLDATGAVLGMGLSYAVNLLNPSAVVLAGTLAEAGDLLITGMQRACRLHTVSALYDELRFVRSRLDDNAGARGAATGIIDEYFALAEQ